MSFDYSSLFVFDAMIAAGVIAASFLFVYTIGRYSIVPTIAALGMGATFAALAPFVGRVPGISAWPAYQQHILIFALMTIAACFVFRRHSYFEPSAMPSKIELAMCAVLIAGFILAVLGSFLPADVVTALSPHMKLLFVDDIQRTLWLVAPVAVFAFMKGR
ncbi:MAG: hypothetical protein AAB473_00510 [Patescibacteria group bacterium]